MYRNIFIPTIITISVLVLALGLWTITRANGDEIKVCVNRLGLMFVLGEGFRETECWRGETLLSWNKQGPPGPKGEKGDKGDPGIASALHLFDANDQDLGILVGVHDSPDQFTTYLPGIKALVKFVQNLNTAELDDSSLTVYFTELDCTGTAFATGVRPMALLRVEGSSTTPIFNGDYVTKLSDINPSDALAAKSRTWPQPDGCRNNAGSPGATDQVLVQFVTLPFTEPLAWPLEIKAD
jgi:hypothetical protein